MLVYSDGRIAGTIGGGALEKKVIEEALDVLKRGMPKVVEHNLVNELAMCCGGTVELFIEPIVNTKKLYIFGAGHIGSALADFAYELDFDVTLCDERYEIVVALGERNYKIINEHHTFVMDQLEFDKNTFVVILTHDHAYDREVLALAAQKPHRYIGMIGSERKAAIAKRNLIASSIISEEQANRIDMPIGVDINAITPSEIAISILAKLIDERNQMN